MRHFKHFTTEERVKASLLLELGYKKSHIAKILKKSPSTITRELKRNSKVDGTYSAKLAQSKYERRRKLCGRKSKLADKEVLEYVKERLEKNWSPEEIAGRMKLIHHPSALSYNAVYRAYHKKLIPRSYKKHFRILYKYKRHKTDDKRGTIADRTPISERPEAASNRSEIGHFEADTVYGKRNTGCIGTFVERQTGMLLALKFDNLRNDVYTKETIKLFSRLPKELRKSFTVDNGKEFENHKELSEGTKMKVYFCDPHSPWQKGSVENINGLLRQYFPKGSSFENISKKKLQEVVNELNCRPRKRLGFLTPLEAASLLILTGFCI